jgi:hypothetical protein
MLSESDPIGRIGGTFNCLTPNVHRNLPLKVMRDVLVVPVLSVGPNEISAMSAGARLCRRCCLWYLERYCSPSFITMVKMLKTRKEGQTTSQGKMKHTILLYCDQDHKGRVRLWNGLDASGLGHSRIP